MSESHSNLEQTKTSFNWTTK